MFNNLEMCQSVLNTLPEAVFMKDKYFRLVFLNEKACSLFGKSREELVGGKAPDSMADPVVSRILKLEKMVLKTGEPQESEERIQGKDNQFRDIFIRISRLMLHSESYLLISLNDVSVLRQSEAQIRYLAYHDPLTGLYNRAAFFEKLQSVLNCDNKPGPNRGALILFDIDGFKTINDTWGHHAGDLALCEFSRQLLRTTPEHCISARIGGDEFALLIEGTISPDDAGNLCLEIIENMRFPLNLNGLSFYMSVSAGISVLDSSDVVAGECLRKSDTALYEAKRAGKNRYFIYSEALDRAFVKKREMEKALTRTLASENGLECVYQPLVRPDVDEIVGVEVLARWNDPELGGISPVQFIPLAEECGLIIPLGEYILRKACRELRHWDGLSVSVNISAVQLNEKNFAEKIIAILDSERFPRKRLELELTETAIIHSDTHGREQLNILRENGIRIALDDFGTGYSSLSLLKNMIVDSVKIDKSFVQSATQLPDAAAIVSAVSTMGNKLNLQVIAEGVETDEQRQFLVDAGCTQLQGHLLSYPLTLDRLEQLMKEKNVS